MKGIGKYFRRSQKNSAPKKEKRKTVKDWLLYFRKKFVESSISRVIAIIIGTVGLIGYYVFDSYIYNPEILLTIEGRVMDCTYNLKPLAMAQISIKGKVEDAITDENGNFSIKVKIRKNDEELFLTCFKQQFEVKKKKIYIPKKNNTFYTEFQLKHNWNIPPEEKIVPQPPLSFSM